MLHTAVLDHLEDECWLTWLQLSISELLRFALRKEHQRHRHHGLQCRPGSIGAGGPSRPSSFLEFWPVAAATAASSWARPL